MAAAPEYCDLIVYADESGDHGLETMDPNFPMFVLALCVFKKSDYVDNVVPALQRFKFKYFGHDAVVLHEREIKKASREFSILQVPAIRTAFLNDLNGIMAQAPFLLIASAIEKVKLKKQYAQPTNPYHLAVGFCLERLYYETNAGPHKGKTIHVVFESRGRKENDELELEFRRVCAAGRYPFEPIFARKDTNSSGLQLADLVARPIGRHVLDPSQPNRAYDILATKFRRNTVGNIHGFGLKCFP
jgi:hypothetical protein